MDKLAIPSEQICSIPRTAELIDAYKLFKCGELSYDALCDIA
ncbi:hypothetical protein [Pseudoalteromonas phenolica]|nr:hypothetical protein [Pseudoalteromonas phenolica]